MTRPWLALALFAVGGVLLISALVASLRGVSADGTGCGSVIAPVHNSSAQIDRMCDSARSDQWSTSWIMGVCGLAALGGGAALRWGGIARQ